jgi:hypothetical protein
VQESKLSGRKMILHLGKRRRGKGGRRCGMGCEISTLPGILLLLEAAPLALLNTLFHTIPGKKFELS